MVKFTYINTINTNISHISFKLNYKYHFYIFYNKYFDPYSKLKIVKKLFFKLQELITIC